MMFKYIEWTWMKLSIPEGKKGPCGEVRTGKDRAEGQPFKYLYCEEQFWDR